jgi:toxin YoeB
MVKWKIVYTKQAQKDAKKLKSANLQEKAIGIIKILEEDPLMSPPLYERLVGDLTGAYSRRINIQHRIVYQMIEKDHIVKVIRMWTHYA